MDFIELKIADDIKKVRELVDQDAYIVKLIKINYNPEIYSLRDIEEVQHFIIKYFPDTPITFEENREQKNITLLLGIE